MREKKWVEEQNHNICNPNIGRVNFKYHVPDISDHNGQKRNKHNC